MGRLGPFEPRPRLAAAVSGGADSLCLCLLADAWARARGGSVLALIVDHGLRAESAEEAREAGARLAARRIEFRVLRVSGLAHGAALAARARAARYGALLAACAEAGVLHLLLGHHAGDQAETRLIRAASDSGAAGLACMAVLREESSTRLLRPLLGVAPERLRATLAAAGEGWAEDPSNQDESSLRVRLRPAARAERDALCEASLRSGRARAEAERAAASELACASLRPEGFAVVRRPMGPAAWSALVQAVGGAPYPPPAAAMARLSARPEPCTVAGVRLVAGARGVLVLREEAAMAPPAPARDGAVWDGRFRVQGSLRGSIGGSGEAEVGALGDDAARLRGASDLPSSVLRTLPALRVGGALLAAPHAGFGASLGVRLVFSPPRPAAAAPFMTRP